MNRNPIPKSSTVELCGERQSCEYSTARLGTNTGQRRSTGFSSKRESAVRTNLSSVRDPLSVVFAVTCCGYAHTNAGNSDQTIALPSFSVDRFLLDVQYNHNNQQR
ncbi:hypothetical protein TNCV_4255371 [Trichonephila clavipes]|nr:hypothetical protein TNCV_4255371 [Trichonephila clavipes]